MAKIVKLVGMYSADMNTFRNLQVIDITSIGAFLDWGYPQDLFLPLNEQTQKVQMHDWVLVYIYFDKQNRPCSSMRVENFLSDEIPTYKIEEKVNLIIFAETELGFKALINGDHMGLLYKNEIFQPLQIGQSLTGYVKKIREDHKIDLNLRPSGHTANEDISVKIIELLEQNNGFFAITDKTSAEEIYSLFGVSKKKYKIALGALYKKRLIQIEDSGLRLV
jgi:uncharacterized protein